MPKEDVDDGWGNVVAVKSTPAIKGARANSAGKAKIQDDLLDNILDDIEQKKGIESSKPRPKTSAPTWGAK